VSGRAARSALPFAVVLVAAACALVAVVSTAPAAPPKSHQPKSHSPTLLWKSFPLVQEPAAKTSKPSHARQASSSTAVGGGDTRDPLVISVLIVIIVSSGLVVLIGVPTRSRVAELKRRVRTTPLTAGKQGGPGVANIGQQTPPLSHDGSDDLVEALLKALKPKEQQRR
jgi:hypothetical protein